MRKSTRKNVRASKITCKKKNANLEKQPARKRN